MLIVALVAAGVGYFAVAAMAVTLRRLVREHARERMLMLNQLLHLAGRTWQPPPAFAEPTAPPLEPDPLFSYQPSGMPDLYAEEPA